MATRWGAIICLTFTVGCDQVPSQQRPDPPLAGQADVHRDSISDPVALSSIERANWFSRLEHLRASLAKFKLLHDNAQTSDLTREKIVALNAFDDEFRSACRSASNDADAIEDLKAKVAIKITLADIETLLNLIRAGDDTEEMEAIIQEDLDAISPT